MSEEESGETSESAETVTPEVTPAQQGSWLDSIDAQYRADPNISKHESVQSLVQEHVNAQSMLGRKGVVIPKDGDPDDVWNNYREAIGAPANAEEYKLEGFTPDERVGWTEDITSGILNVAAKHSLPDAAVRDIFNEYQEWATGIVDGNAQSVADINAAADQQLRKDFGAAYDARLGVAEAAVHALTNGAPDTVAHIQLADGTLLGDNPQFIKIMAEVGQGMSEKGLIGSKRVNNNTMTPEEAQKALDKLEADPDKYDLLYKNTQHPGHREVVAERERLLNLAFPDEA